MRIVLLALSVCLIFLFMGVQKGWNDYYSPELLDKFFVQNMYKLSHREPEFFKSCGFGGNAEQLLFVREKDKLVFSIHNTNKGFTFYFLYDPPEYPVIDPLDLDVELANKLFDKLVFPDEKNRAKQKLELARKLRKISN